KPVSVEILPLSPGSDVLTSYQKWRIKLSSRCLGSPSFLTRVATCVVTGRLLNLIRHLVNIPYVELPFVHCWYKTELSSSTAAVGGLVPCSNPPRGENDACAGIEPTASWSNATFLTYYPLLSSYPKVKSLYKFAKEEKTGDQQNLGSCWICPLSCTLTDR
uniref:Uncharacterized protein n=1 Tax=Scophthalmus maximus TaxID=52904 RepID=A0A8D3BSS1_SCOMX